MADKLTADQLAALVPGHTVIIESNREGVRRPRRSTGTVAHVDGAHIFIKTPAPEAGPSWTATVAATASASVASAGQRRQTLRIDTLYRAWVRNRGDVETLRELYDAIADHLAGSNR